jgi:RNA polymerase sigma-70 factor (ECF subfamily)
MTAAASPGRVRAMQRACEKRGGNESMGFGIAMETVIERFGPALWRLAGSFEFDPSRREDLHQDMLVAIWRALPGLKDADRLKAYVFRIARNRAVSHVSRRARVPRDESLVEDRVSGHACPYEEAEQSERQRRLRQAVHSLPLGQRETVTLFLEGLSHAEIAEILDISENNVAVRINRARTHLSRRLSR